MNIVLELVFFYKYVLKFFVIRGGLKFNFFIYISVYILVFLINYYNW